eukprot:ANDGO_05520.mRNA.1 Sister chromatid cohesion 1 protein 4
MFFSTNVLTKKGPLARIWIAAFEARSLKRPEITSTDIEESVESIMNPDVPIALRTSGHLLLGVVRIHSKKIDFLLQDAVDAKLKVQISVVRVASSAMTALSLSKTTSKRAAVTLALQELPASFATWDVDITALPAFALHDHSEVLMNSSTSQATAAGAAGALHQKNVSFVGFGAESVDRSFEDEHLSVYDTSRQSLTEQEATQSMGIRYDTGGFTDIEEPEMLRAGEVEMARFDGGAEELGFGMDEDFAPNPIAKDAAESIPDFDTSMHDLSIQGPTSSSVVGGIRGSSAPAAVAPHPPSSASGITERRKLASKRKRNVPDSVTELDSKRMRDMIKDPSALVRTFTIQDVLGESDRAVKRRRLDALPSVDAMAISGSILLQQELAKMMRLSAVSSAVSIDGDVSTRLDESVEEFRGEHITESVMVPSSPGVHPPDTSKDAAVEFQESQDISHDDRPSALSFVDEELGFGMEDESASAFRHSPSNTVQYESLSALLNAKSLDDSIDFANAVSKIGTPASRRARAAKAFYHMLILQSQGVIETRQAHVFGNISMRRVRAVPEVSA